MNQNRWAMLTMKGSNDAVYVNVDAAKYIVEEKWGSTICWPTTTSDGDSVVTLDVNEPPAEVFKRAVIDYQRNKTPDFIGPINGSCRVGSLRH